MAHIDEGSHRFTCHPHVYPQAEWTIPACTPQRQSVTALWLVLNSCPAEDRRLSWPGWLSEILRWFIRRRQSPIPVLTGPDTESVSWSLTSLFSTNMTISETTRHRVTLVICQTMLLLPHTVKV